MGLSCTILERFTCNRPAHISPIVCILRSRLCTDWPKHPTAGSLRSLAELRRPESSDVQCSVKWCATIALDLIGHETRAPSLDHTSCNSCMNASATCSFPAHHHSFQVSSLCLHLCKCSRSRCKISISTPTGHESSGHCALHSHNPYHTITITDTCNNFLVHRRQHCDFSYSIDTPSFAFRIDSSLPSRDYLGAWRSHVDTHIFTLRTSTWTICSRDVGTELYDYDISFIAFKIRPYLFFSSVDHCDDICLWTEYLLLLIERLSE